MNSGNKIVGIMAILFVLALFSAIIAAMRLETEVARHEVTQTELRGVRDECEQLNATLGTARAGIAALQARIGEVESLRISERERSAQREKIFQKAKTVPADAAGVVDAETSREVIRHINETLARNAAY